MKKEQVVITRRARASIKEIYEYIKEREKSVAVAQYVRTSIVNKCKSLKDFSGYSVEPYLEEYPEGYQSVSIWDYVIIYLSDDKKVKVLNVVSGRQHPEVRENI